jgi:hypothetical protein
MPKVLSGWRKVHTKTHSGAVAHYMETITYGSGVIADCLCSPFGQAYCEGSNRTEHVPNPPPGVDWTIMFIANDTMSTGGDVCVYGAQEAGGTFAMLMNDTVQYDANTTSNPQAKADTYVQRPGATPDGGFTPAFKFFLDDDGVNSTSVGREKTAEIHLMWTIP